MSKEIIEPTVEPVVEQIIVKVPDTNEIKPEVVKSEIKPEEKQKRKYTKDPNKKYGNPEWKKGKAPTKAITTSNDKKIVIQNKVQTKPQQKPSKVLFYAGMGIGIAITICGIVYAYRKIKEHLKSIEEVKALKYISEELEKENNTKIDQELN